MGVSSGYRSVKDDIGNVSLKDDLYKHRLGAITRPVAWAGAARQAGRLRSVFDHRGVRSPASQSHPCVDVCSRAAQGVMSDITIYYNPFCVISRNTLALIRHAGIEPTVVDT